MQAAPPPAPVFIPEDPSSLRPIFRAASIACADRGLSSSSKWAAELLHALPKSPKQHVFRTSTPVKGGRGAHVLPPMPMSGIGLGARGRARGGMRDSLGSVMEMEGSSPGGLVEEDMGEGEDVDEDEEDTYLLALSYFRVHEHLRAAHLLKDCRGSKARWLRGYSKYLAGEKRAQEENGELLGPKDKNVRNPYAQQLLNEMATYEEGVVENDGWLLFLKSLLVLALPPLSPSPMKSPEPSTSSSTLSSDVRQTALDLLTKSVTLEPYNWAAWLKLASCIDGPEELGILMKYLPNVLPTTFFYIHAVVEIHSATEALHKTLDELKALLGDCSIVKGLRGLLHYHIREFDEAGAYFVELRQSDPYRIEDIDIFSNILYVSEKRADLATLAQDYIKMDRSRPEVCCLVGNYYSMRRDHEKAIVYFRRALQLDRGYLSAWTLMGHEYVEIKNTNAAIASYRRAVDVNRKDYRAWYGLGQTYELMGEPYYALNYYTKATALRPYDARMWGALAACYEKLKKIPDAIKAFQRGLVCSEIGENDTALRIGRLYALIGDSTRAAAYHRRALREGISSELPKSQLSKIYLWLARWQIQRAKSGDEEADFGEAEKCCQEAMGVQEDKEEAVGLMKEVRALAV
ncbi:hypothetical protein MNV49_004719 [Pseudohyphozyma bogoriensis]|nr:hypothetical protein MNV49_004719 [Pseudohyphozyma bogoriensis]